MLWTWLMLACATPNPATVENVRRPGGESVVLHIADGRFTEAGEGETVDLSGHYVVPAFIDSHTHLAYRPGAQQMRQGGIAAVVDLAAPEPWLADPPTEVLIAASGPMITAEAGYPTQSWGRDGFGIECTDLACATAAIDRLKAAGIRVVKVPLVEPSFDDATLVGIVDHAHSADLPVVAHATTDAAARRAADVGVDWLAHTPTTPLAAETVAAWADRGVISTLGAFGGAPTTVQNLKALREAGATVVYGTDYGNTTTPGIDPREIQLLDGAGLDGAAIVQAATATPAAAFGFSDLGTLEPGARASFLVLDGDPHDDPSVLGSPIQVWIDGERVD